MDDLISRQAAIDAVMQYCPDDDGSCSKADRDIRELLDDIENLPSAQPDIIRCKDCKFYTAYDYTGKLMCKRIGKGMILPKPEDYCSYAERSTNETD